MREGNSKRSLENVNAWNAGLLRGSAAEWPHDIAVWLTRYDLGGPSGYAPVAGVCDPDRSCSLKCFLPAFIIVYILVVLMSFFLIAWSINTFSRDEGLTSAFIIAHEVGHV